MKTTLTVAYKLRRLLPILGIAFVSLLSSCSKDDDTPNSNELSGTTWTILSDSYDDDLVGLPITFKKNGNFIVSTPDHDNFGWPYAKWSYSNNNLRIVIGDKGPEEYMEGKYVINGNNATYTYSWYYYRNGEKQEEFGDGTYVMTLVKK